MSKKTRESTNYCCEINGIKINNKKNGMHITSILSVC